MNRKRGIGKMLIYGLVALAVIVIILVGIIITRPDDFRVSRTAVMAASPAAVFEQINDFHKWEAWSPWAKMDPNAKNTYDGPTSGTGSILSWVGNKNVGEGSMEIIESRPGELVQLRLDFVKPFKGTNTVNLTLKPEGDATRLTWEMFGKNNFIGKAVGLFMNCEKMVGGQLDAALAGIKSIVESEAGQ